MERIGAKASASGGRFGAVRGGTRIVEATAGLKLRFQADADFKNSAVLAIRRRWPGIDIRSAPGLIPDALSDPDVLALAAADGRVLLTHDASTMPGHFSDFIKEHESAGLILVRQDRSIASIIEGVFLAWSTWTADDLRNSIRWLPR